MDAHLLSCHCDFQPRYSLHLLTYTTCILWHLLAFQKFNMDPRKFLAPIQCTLCDLLLYTMRDVSEHSSRHDVINLLCHHCLTNFDTKGAIAAHMNQKGAHLRQCLIWLHIWVPCHRRHRVLQRWCHFCSRLLSRLRPCPGPRRPLRSPSLIMCHLTSYCGTLMPQTQVRTHLPSLQAYFHRFNHKLPRRSNIHLCCRTCLLLLGNVLEVRYRIPQENTGNCANRTLNINFCSGGVYITLNHYMHRRRRRAVSSTLPYVEFCGKRRSRRLSLTKILPLKKLWHNFTTSMLERSSNSLKLLPFFHPHFFPISFHYFAYVH